MADTHGVRCDRHVSQRVEEWARAIAVEDSSDCDPGAASMLLSGEEPDD
jgi:hypothetical protein